MLNLICNVSGSDCHHIEFLINSIQVKVNYLGDSYDYGCVENKEREGCVRQFKDENTVTLKVNSTVLPILIQAEGRNDLALVCPVCLTEKLVAA